MAPGGIAVQDPAFGYNNMGSMMGYGSGWWAIYNTLFMLILLGVVLVLILWLMKLWKEIARTK